MEIKTLVMWVHGTFLPFIIKFLLLLLLYVGIGTELQGWEQILMFQRFLLSGTGVKTEGWEQINLAFQHISTETINFCFHLRHCIQYRFCLPRVHSSCSQKRLCKELLAHQNADRCTWFDLLDPQTAFDIKRTSDRLPIWNNLLSGGPKMEACQSQQKSHSTYSSENTT